MGNKFVPLGIIIIAVMLSVFGRPLVFQYRDVRAQIKAKNIEIDVLQKRKQKLIALQPELTSAQGDINALKLAMPSAQQIPEVLVMAEAIANRSGLKITGMEIQPTSGEKENEVVVGLSGQGTYENLLAFTGVLERNVRPIQIRSLTIGRAAKGNQVTATVSMGLIYQGVENQQVGTN